MSKSDRETRTFTGKKLKVLEALIVGKSREEAGILAGVSSRTIRRWLEDDEFAAALRQATDEHIKNASRRLAGGIEKALDELYKLLEKADVADNVKLKAIGMIIDAAPKYNDSAIWIERIERLEKMFRERNA